MRRVFRLKKTWFGLTGTSLTICIGIPVIICILSFLNTGALNIPGTVVMFLIMVACAKGLQAIITVIKKRNK